jgi:hypothetical protein
MKVTHSETGFRYVYFEIENNDNSYQVVKAFDPFSSMSIEDQNGIEVTDIELINKINQIIENYCSTHDTSWV